MGETQREEESREMERLFPDNMGNMEPAEQ
jgi:hypothetical protein